tara:strand:+ start:268 stop:525 length:258 start_codon:yes stop_codon:yes gene_type:complete
MENKNKNITALYCLAIMFTVWCTWNSVNSGSIVAKVAEYKTDVQLFQRQVANLIDIANSQEKQEEELKAIEEMLPTEEIKEEATE